MRIKSGIKGLDPLIGGGFEEGSMILVSGGAGTGKTIFGLQFLYQGALDGEGGLFISFEEEVNDLKRDAKVFGWNFEEFEREGRIVMKYYPPFEFKKFVDELRPIITQRQIKRLVIDSTSAFGMYLKDPYEIRRNLWSLSKMIKDLGCTTVIISEILSGEKGTGTFSRFGVEEFVSDAVILLHYAGIGGGYDRGMQIIKMRRTNHKRGLFPMRIRENGIEVSEEVQEE